jgi:hypothetical protein
METEPDQSGADLTIEPRGMGAQGALGELIACPTCTATRAAPLLVYGVRLLPRPGHVFPRRHVPGDAPASGMRLASAVHGGIR